MTNTHCRRRQWAARTAATTCGEPRFGRASRAALLAALALALALGGLLAWTSRTTAHPLGNFTINRFSRVELAERAVRVHYVVDFAEIPAYQEIARFDGDDDGSLDQREQDAYLARRADQLVDGLHLSAGTEPLTLEPTGSSLAFGIGEVGLPIIRLEIDYQAQLPAGASEIALAYRDDNFPGRLGWREIVARPLAGVDLLASDVPSESPSDELRHYPADFYMDPLDIRSATLRLRLNPTAAGTSPLASNADTSETARASDDRLQRMKSQVTETLNADRATPSLIIIALLAAGLWGAAHALTPGHGKAVVAAYLVGTRGTPRHAALLGLTVTLTHTAGVFALGGLTLWLSRYLLPEDLYPWLSAGSGLLVVLIGASLVYRRLRPQADHEHGHGHDHSHGGHTHDHDHDGHHLPPGAGGSKITTRSLLALGVSGGLVPCPSALVLLLSAISLGRLGFGIVLVLAFSLGLAVVLTGIGLLSIYARRVFQRFSFEPRLPRLIPVISALVVTFAGLAIMLGALEQAGVISF